MFSFGSIKFNTAFYGAVSLVKDANGLCETMSKIQESYSLYALADYAKKIKNMKMVKKVIHNKWLVWSTIKYFEHKKQDMEDYLVSKLRGFASTDNFLNKFRLKCNAALIKNMIYRIESYTPANHNDKISNYSMLNNKLVNSGLFVPGCAWDQDRSFWQFPFLVANKTQFVDFAQHNGLLCFRGSTQVKLIP